MQDVLVYFQKLTASVFLSSASCFVNDYEKVQLPCSLSFPNSAEIDFSSITGQSVTISLQLSTLLIKIELGFSFRSKNERVVH